MWISKCVLFASMGVHKRQMLMGIFYSIANTSWIGIGRGCKKEVRKNVIEIKAEIDGQNKLSNPDRYKMKWSQVFVTCDW